MISAHLRHATTLSTGCYIITDTPGSESFSRHTVSPACSIHVRCVRPSTLQRFTETRLYSWPQHLWFARGAANELRLPLKFGQGGRTRTYTLQHPTLVAYQLAHTLLRVNVDERDRPITAHKAGEFAIPRLDGLQL